jgi:hypothetical protein
VKKTMIPLILLVILASGCARIRPPQPEMETWAFCGPSPNSPYAFEQLRSLRDDSGIDNVFGHCNPPDWSSYTTAYPGQRYMRPSEYLALVQQAEVLGGIKVVVYDARIWSNDPEIRQEALNWWMPYTDVIRAWDMGDEFDPNYADWGILKDRWAIIEKYITPVTGIEPFTNHMSQFLDQAMVDLPGSTKILSYDDYDVERSLETARKYDPQTETLVCAVNALKHGPWDPTPWGIEFQMSDHRDAGCDEILIFGGVMPTDTPGFDTPSLVDEFGHPTWLAYGVFEGSTR